jgi:hypothetical protein
MPSTESFASDENTDSAQMQARSYMRAANRMSTELTYRVGVYVNTDY